MANFAILGIRGRNTKPMTTTLLSNRIVRHLSNSYSSSSSFAVTKQNFFSSRRIHTWNRNSGRFTTAGNPTKKGSFLTGVAGVSAGFFAVAASTTAAVAVASCDESNNEEPKHTPANVLAWGNNANLTVPGHREEVVLNPSRVAYFDNLKVKSMSFASTHGAAVDEKGDVHVWGRIWEEKGQQHESSSSSAAKVSNPRPVLVGESAVKVVCTEESAYVLSSSGNVFVVDVKEVAARPAKDLKALGSYKRGWFGDYTFPLVPFPLGHSSRSDRLVDIEGGGHHVIALTLSGKVYSCADSDAGNVFGQLGIGSDKKLSTLSSDGSSQRKPEAKNEGESPFKRFVAVKGLDNVKVKQICAGNTHNIVLAGDGRVYAFGNDRFLQLGMGDFTASKPISLPMPTLVTSVPPKADKDKAKVYRIAAGGDTTFFLSSPTSSSSSAAPKGEGDGRQTMYVCGSGLYGTLGLGRYIQMAGKPLVCDSFSSKVYYDEKDNCTRSFSVEALRIGNGHVMARVKSGGDSTANEDGGSSIWIWGYNKFGQCGTGKISNVPKPVLTVPYEQQTYLKERMRKLNVTTGDGSDSVGSGDGTGMGAGPPKEQYVFLPPLKNCKDSSKMKFVAKGENSAIFT
eukprot:Nk52_evm1s1203 gene=Nk52_evmTU1s1203